MALGTFADGEYTITYGGASVGILGDGGAVLRYRISDRDIADTSTYADIKIDGIYRGINAFMVLTFKEWTATTQAAMYPWGAGTRIDGTIGVIGRLGSAVAKALVLTAVAGTPAATNGPATLTASLAKLAPDNDVSTFFGPDERDVPVLLELLPYDDAGTKRVWKITDPA